MVLNLGNFKMRGLQLPEFPGPKGIFEGEALVES